HAGLASEPYDEHQYGVGAQCIRPNEKPESTAFIVRGCLDHVTNDFERTGIHEAQAKPKRGDCNRKTNGLSKTVPAPDVDKDGSADEERGIIELQADGPDVDLIGVSNRDYGPHKEEHNPQPHRRDSQHTASGRPTIEQIRKVDDE